MSSVSSKYTDEVALGGAWREAEFQFGFQMNWNAVSSSAQGPPSEATPPPTLSHSSIRWGFHISNAYILDYY